jgi:hypothetical protein
MSLGGHGIKQILRSGFLLIAGCGVLGLGARAQIILYATDFPDAQGWTLTGLLPPDPCWAVDATPAFVLGTSSWLSAPFSLNFNNGVNYHPEGQGRATSPPIHLGTGSGNKILRYWCNASTEFNLPCYWDT